MSEPLVITDWTPILVTICIVLGCALTYSIHLEQELQKKYDALSLKYEALRLEQRWQNS